MKNSISKTQAIKTAQGRVSSIYAFGTGQGGASNYRFSVWDEQCNGWRESTPTYHASAQAQRRARVVSYALELYGIDEVTAEFKAFEWSECKGDARTIFNAILKEIGE